MTRDLTNKHTHERKSTIQKLNERETQHNKKKIVQERRQKA